MHTQQEAAHVSAILTPHACRPEVQVGGKSFYKARQRQEPRLCETAAPNLNTTRRPPPGKRRGPIMPETVCINPPRHANHQENKVKQTGCALAGGLPERQHAEQVAGRWLQAVARRRTAAPACGPAGALPPLHRADEISTDGGRSCCAKSRGRRGGSPQLKISVIFCSRPPGPLYGADRSIK